MGNGSAPTIHDVAAACGVAASTVSRAFSQPGRVSVDTRERIIAAAERMGYRPSPIARALPSGRTTTLALLVPDITNPFFFDLIRGAERQAAAADYTLVLADTEESAETESRVMERLSRGVDGFVLGASRRTDAEIRTAHARRPLVAINRRITGIPHVVIDTADGVRQAAEHLTSFGHHRMAYVAGPRTSWADTRRWRSLQGAARRLNLELHRIGPNEPTLEAGADAADACLLAEVTAIVTFNDLLAIGIVQRLRARDVEVPRDLSVVGSDNSFGADLCHPRLTTLDAPIESAGRSAVSLLLATLDDATAAAVGSAHSADNTSRSDTRPNDGITPPRTNVSLPTRLEIRDSTGPAPRHRTRTSTPPKG